MWFVKYVIYEALRFKFQIDSFWVTCDFINSHISKTIQTIFGQKIPYFYLALKSYN